MKAGYREIRKKNGNFTAVLYEILKVILFLKDNLLEEKAYKKFLKANDELLKTEKKNFLNVGIFITQLILIGAGGILFIKGKITIGVIVSFLLLVDRFKISLIKLAGLTDTYHKGRAGINRFEEMLNIDLSLPDGTEELKDEFKILEFKNVSFSYSKNFPVPLFPTTAIFSPFLILKLKLLRTGIFLE